MADLGSPIHRPNATDLFNDAVDHHPTWFKQTSFLSPNFDPDSYISDLRSFVPFSTLRSELNSLSASLNHQLVDLINRDYGDFVSLSTRLVDVDGAVVRMRAPLVDIRDKILGFRHALQLSLNTLRNGMAQRNEASAAREVLELLLDTFHVVSKVEKLIKELPTVPSDWPNGQAEKDHLSNGLLSSQTENGTSLRETQSMLLERIASEMNRLKFYITHAQNLPFIENMVKRIQNSSQLLDASLGHCFVDGLEHKDASAIYNCLRAYAAIDNTTSAEEIFRLTIVAPLIHKVIPHTSTGEVGRSMGDGLEEDYKQIKEYIETDCKFLLEISFTENSGLHVFSFMANSILKEVLSAIQKGKPGAFSPGRPTEFLKNYKSSLEFLAHLEGMQTFSFCFSYFVFRSDSKRPSVSFCSYVGFRNGYLIMHIYMVNSSLRHPIIIQGCCPTRSAVAKFRTEAVYIEFMKQWNIGVYFSLRFQEIASALDSALTGANLIPVTTSLPESENLQNLVLKQSITLLECLRSCWREDIFVVSCADKFLRLSFQLISRYSNWLSSGLTARKAVEAGTNPGSEWAISASPDDFVYVIHDLDSLVAEICGGFMDNVVELFSSCATEVRELIKQSILQGGKSLKDLLPLTMKAVIHMLVEKCAEELVQLKALSTQYRVTNKPPPVRHSAYVSGVLRPLKAFLDGERVSTYLTKELRNEILQGAAVGITVRYHDSATDTVNMLKKTELSLLKLRQGAQRRAGASSDVSDNNISNADKICMQLFLDIQEYARNLAGLGVDAAKIEAYQSLWQCVAPAGRQNTISF